MNVVVMHKLSMTVINFINVDSITYDATNNYISVHGQTPTSGAAAQTHTYNNSEYIVRIMSN